MLIPVLSYCIVVIINFYIPNYFCLSATNSYSRFIIIRNKVATKTYLYPNHHIQVTLTILFDHIAHVVRFPCLLKLPPGHEVLNLPDRPYGVSMCFRQPENCNDSIFSQFTHTGNKQIFQYTYTSLHNDSPFASQLIFLRFRLHRSILYIRLCLLYESFTISYWNKICSSLLFIKTGSLRKSSQIRFKNGKNRRENIKTVQRSLIECDKRKRNLAQVENLFYYPTPTIDRQHSYNFAYRKYFPLSVHDSTNCFKWYACYLSHKDILEKSGCPSVVYYSMLSYRE